jgi:ribonucleotide reductase alpha subunit
MFFTNNDEKKQFEKSRKNCKNPYTFNRIKLHIKITQGPQDVTSKFKKTQLSINAVEDDMYLKADGFDDAIIGTAYGTTVSDDEGPVLVYDIQKCIDILMDGAVDMTREEAIEYFDFNVLGAFMGPQTPIFMNSGDADLVKALIADD